MALKVVVYEARNRHRSHVICEAMLRGLRCVGQQVTHRFEQDYRGVEADVAIFYGLHGKLQRAMADYSARAKAVYVDLGYWGRENGGRWAGYHKVSVNDRHPTAYFQRVPHVDDRACKVGIQIQPWRDDGDHILLAGMGAKGARAEGYSPEQWERDTIAKLRKHTNRPIVYRPKPSWSAAKPIAGTIFGSPREPVDAHLRNCHAVVTHHSNVAVDAIAAGVPAFVWRGVATKMGCDDLSKIEKPRRPDDRQQWVNDIAYCQFRVSEMRQGVVWQHLVKEGLV